MPMPKNLKSLLFSSIILSLAACSGGDNKKKPVPDPVAFNYQAAIDNAITEFVPGIILQVEKPGFKFLGCAGLADIETQTPMQTYHVMPTGSAGKKITALLTVMLDEEGLLNLDDTLDTWLSDELLAQIEHSEKITLRQLLNHTAGIHNYLSDPTQEDYKQALLAEPETLKTDSDILPFGLNQPAYFLPGEGFYYSNTGYLLVGLILDEVLGEHHSSAIRNRILNPFGMNVTIYNGVENEKSQHEMISGYLNDDEDGMVNIKPYLENVGLSDGPLRSSVEDMTLLLKYIAGHYGYVSEYVKEQLFGESALMSWGEPYYGITDESASYGLGLFKETINNQVVYHHDGHEPGYRTVNIYISDSQTSITAFFNCGNDVRCDPAANALTETILLNELQKAL
ncbi:serine hydrolase domain-containing protein [Colwellia psychrerythraea]|uniref:Beta-lactamase n=1 Tax=Colwellia psychrerythraea TaxID=28229 RepID=A0A099KD16_COLPS|nr:serine hydrolase domain-containing protein [Colwellia psychrerythraea]KGJ88205.1 beta-lactamase [Colwellia psychrerythraea]